MSNDERSAELRRFLKDRRARLTPADAGLPETGRRRVRGLRREEVAMLANIGVSWYTVLESGDARGVSDQTLGAVADALRLDDSERHYLFGIANRLPPVDDFEKTPEALVAATLDAIAFPAYLITEQWDIRACNAAFRRGWGVAADEVPFGALERLFLHPAARAMHGERFESNAAPVIAMLHSAIGRRPESERLQHVRAAIFADERMLELWNRYEVRGPLVPNRAAIDSPIGPFAYETLNLPITGAPHGLVVQVPDTPSRRRLTVALAADGARS